MRSAVFRRCECEWRWNSACGCMRKTSGVRGSCTCVTVHNNRSLNGCAEQGNLEEKYKRHNAEFSASPDPFQSNHQTPNTNTVTPMSSSFYDELPPSNYIFAETAMASIHGTRLIQHVPSENHCPWRHCIRKLGKSWFSHMICTNPIQHYIALTTAHNLLDACCRATMVLSIECNITSVMCDD